jgi:hypothetical protein
MTKDRIVDTIRHIIVGLNLLAVVLGISCLYSRQSLNNSRLWKKEPIRAYIVLFGITILLASTYICANSISNIGKVLTFRTVLGIIYSGMLVMSFAALRQFLKEQLDQYRK